MDIQELSVSPDREIVSTRVVRASRTELYHVWIDPVLLAQWWGPAGFTNTFHEFNPTPGGRWRFTMHGPEKGNYENEVVFLKLEEPAVIAWDRVSKPLFRIVATFHEVAADRTQLVFRMQFATKEECDKLRPFVIDKNEENFDKLEALLLDH